MPRMKKTSNKKESKIKEEDEVKLQKITKSTKKVTENKSPVKNTTSTLKKNTTKNKVAKNKSKKNVVNAKRTKKQSSKISSKSSQVKKSISEEKNLVVSPSKPTSIEYYDLPYRYNQTIVKVLAQTPTTLFVYWDISDDDREKFVQEFGENLFNDSSPVLIIHNKTKNYSFEIEINDFANCWYFNVTDAKCEYEIELGRRKKPFTQILIPNDYVYITSSNVIEAPNNRILFEPNMKTVFFRNVKKNQTFTKDFATFSFMEKSSQIYNIYDIYKEIYKEEELIEAINNPTSSGSSLSFYTKNN